MAKAEWKTAAEIMAEREADPEWVARRDAREAEQQAKEERSIAEQALLLADLRKVGRHVRWIWDLVNTTESYPEAVPVLIDHLRRPYRDGIREGIARALAVREARGLAGRVVVDTLHESGLGRPLRWALANTLTVVADRTNIEGVKSVLAVEPDKDVASRLTRALKTANKP